MIALADVFENREWLRRATPFPHVVAHNVFRPSFYASLCGEMQNALRLGLSETPAQGRFSRNLQGYDAYGMGFGSSAPGALGLFTSPEWRDTIATIFGIGRTPYIFAGAHHHAIGGRDGFVHNDFNPVWFPRADASRIQAPHQEVCSYKTGAGSLSLDEKIEVVRGAVVLFFLLNDSWRPGDGGEIALFDRDDMSRPVVRCPPINNSLVGFECTPCSFHAFRMNHRLPRTSIIMWVHRTFEEAAARFGADGLEHWK